MSPSGRAAELVGAMRGAAGDRQRVDLGAHDEVDRLVGIGQQLVVGEHALRAVTVLGLALAALQRAEHAELALDRGADMVCHAGDPLGDFDIVVVARRGLGIGQQGAVHHHRGEAVADRRQAGRLVVAVVLVHADRDFGVDLGQRVDHAGKHDVVGVAAGAARGLQDDRRVGGARRFHDRQALLHVVDVEGGNAVAMLGRMVEKLAKGDAGHVGSSPQAMRSRAAAATASGVISKWR